MHLILCLDDKNGMLFNRRRQSRDAVLCERVLALAADSTLWIGDYSQPLFPTDRVFCAEDYLTRAAKGDYCFAETPDFLHADCVIESVTVYRWNRIYPADVRLDPTFLAGRTCVRTEEFAGKSHERITEEVYV